jgi:hypothetical protein
MTAGYRTPLERRLAEEIKALRSSVRALQGRPMRIPILDADPDTTDPTNLWMLQDGRLRVRNASGTVKEYTPTGSPGGTTSGTTKPPVTTTKTYVGTYNAAWSQSYNNGGSGQRTDTNHLYYGRVDSFNDLQMAMAGWGSFTSILSGASVKKVELYLSNLHAWFNSGVVIKIGKHHSTSAPSNFSQDEIMGSWKYGKPDAHWITLPLSFGNSLKAGTRRGITLYQSSSNVAYYGYAEGVGDDHPPKLRITYTK